MSLMKRIKLSSTEIRFLELMCVWPCSQRPFRDSKHTKECFILLVSYINSAWYNLCQKIGTSICCRDQAGSTFNQSKGWNDVLELADVFSESWVSSAAGSNYSQALCTLGGEVAREPDLLTSDLDTSDLLTSEPRGSLLLTKITCWQFQFINSSNLSRRKEEEEEEEEGKEKE